jgi:aryl-alcohol dehydrogenase-like predicted oxidoreductase
VFEVLDQLKQAGKILHYGVSVEKVEEALKAIEYQVSPRSRSFSTFSDKVLKTCFSHSHSSATLGFSSGLPLSSGLLSRKITHQTVFAADDHLNFNRHGEQF